MQRVLLLTGMHPTEPVLWHRGTEAGSLASGTASSLDALPEDVLNAEHVSVILPGELAATRRLTLPVNRDGALEAAARLAFEDILATPAQECHFAFGHADADGQREVCAVPEIWVEEWTVALKEAGLQPTLLTIDHLVLKVEGRRNVILHDGERTMIRLLQGGMTVETSFAQELIPQLEGAGVAEIVSTTPLTGATVILPEPRTKAAFFAAALTGQTVPDLLRGRFRPRQDWQATIREWRVPMGLATACLLVWLTGVAIDGMRHAAAAEEIETTARDRFVAAYPSEPVRDLQRQANSRAATGGVPTFLPLTSVLTAKMEQTEAMEVAGLRYTASAGLVADLRFPETEQIEQLRERLRAEGILTREGAQALRRDQDNRWAGQLLLEGMQ